MPASYTVPPLWTADLPISVIRLNQLLGVNGDIPYLFTRPQFFGRRTTNLQTTSTTYVDMDTTNLQGVVTPTGTLLLIMFHILSATGRDPAAFEIVVDGSGLGGANGVARWTGQTSGQAVAGLHVATVSAGSSHTIKLQWKDAAFSTFANVDYATLAILEIG